MHVETTRFSLYLLSGDGGYLYHVEYAMRINYLMSIYMYVYLAKMNLNTCNYVTDCMIARRRPCHYSHGLHFNNTQI